MLLYSQILLKKKQLFCFGLVTLSPGKLIWHISQHTLPGKFLLTSACISCTRCSTRAKCPYWIASWSNFITLRVMPRAYPVSKKNSKKSRIYTSDIIKEICFSLIWIVSMIITVNMYHYYQTKVWFDSKPEEAQSIPIIFTGKSRHFLMNSPSDPCITTFTKSSMALLIWSRWLKK